MSGMPRFFLHIRDGDDLIEDPDGSVLPDVEAARAEALASARDILAGLLKAGRILNGQCIEIVDEFGILRATVLMRDAIRPA